MYIVKINRDSIRRNPNFQKTRTVPSLKKMIFKADNRATTITERGCVIKYEEFKLGENYLVSHSYIGDGTLEVVAESIGRDLPSMVKGGKEWEGIEVEIVNNHLYVGTDNREFLYDYEPLPDFIKCYDCQSSINPRPLTFITECPVCGAELVKYESFSIKMVE